VPTLPQEVVDRIKLEYARGRSLGRDRPSAHV
jgi:hypothetical protein